MAKGGQLTVELLPEELQLSCEAILTDFRAEISFAQS